MEKRQRIGNKKEESQNKNEGGERERGIESRRLNERKEKEMKRQ